MSEATKPRWKRVREGVLIAAVVAAAISCAVRGVNPSLELTRRFDSDTVDVLQAFERDPSFGYLLSWYYADGPQGVHTFRPLQYTLLRAEYILFGWTVWPYQAVNWLLFCATAAGIFAWLRLGGASREVALAAAAATLAWPSDQNHVIINLLCTLSEVLCGLFGVWAAWALLGWMDQGGRKWTARYGGLLLAAFLSKEMALGVAIAFVVTIAFWPASWRRRLAAIGVTTAVSVLWLVWFKLAETRMIIPVEHIPGGHTFVDLWGRLAEDPSFAMRCWLHNVYQPLWRIVHLWYAGVGDDLLWTYDFWRALPALFLWPIGVVLAWRRHPKLIWMWLCWNVVSYLPVLPLNDLVPWYQYIPDLFDRAFDVLAAVAIVVWVQRWWQRRNSERPTG